MGDTTKISWCDKTFNAWLGCSKVSPGCANCYAENQVDFRYKRVQWGPNGTRSRTAVDYWKKPIRWNKEAQAAGVRARVFCSSLADVFEDWQGPIMSGGKQPVILSKDLRASSGPDNRLTMDDCRRDLFKLIDQTPNLTWLLLTKRPENIGRMMPAFFPGRYIAEAGAMNQEGPRENVWLGTTIESMDQADRWAHLVENGSKLCDLLWISAEPLLGPLNVFELSHLGRRPDWIIFGGESAQGAPARPCSLEWIRNGVRQCREAGIVPFVKQLGSAAFERVDANGDCFHEIKLRDSAGADPSEWPEDLRVREYPGVAAA